MPFPNIKKEIIEIDDDDSLSEESLSEESLSEESLSEESLSEESLSEESLSKEIVINHENTDSVVYSIIEQFKQRSDFGMKKYGTNLDRKDLNPIDWVQHAQEEHMDAILYLEKLKQVLSDMEFKMKYLENQYVVNGETRIFFILFIFLLFYNLFYHISL